MCKPTYYDIEYVINPWMNPANQPEKTKSFAQWQALHDTYLALGVTVEVIEQVKGLPDMVFTANSGTVWGNTFVSGNYRYKERKGEEQHFQKWFTDHGFEVKTLEHFQGGEGDALFYRGTLYMGHGFRSDKESHKEMGQILGVSTVSLRLVDPYFYDFDTAFCPVGDKGVLYFPEAFDNVSRKIVAHLPGAIPMTATQAEHFIGNSVLVGKTLLVSYLDKDLESKFKKLGVTPKVLDMSEYKKAGGGIKCLTLYIDRG